MPVASIRSLIVGIGKRPIGVQVGDEVPVDIDERDHPQPITRGDAGDFIEIKLAIPVEIFGKDPGNSLLDVEKKWTVEPGAEPLGRGCRRVGIEHDLRACCAGEKSR